MAKYLLLIILSSWSLLVSPSRECETGVAYVDSILSVPRSLMANADVALLTTNTASSVEKCMEDCCSGKYGECTVASFKKNITEHNCMHFYCRPVKKCKFLSSPSTDSFSFSSKPTLAHSVPSSHNLTTVTSKLTTPEAKSNEPSQKKEEVSPFSDEQFALKNDNTTIKPRKGVHNFTPDDLLAKSGIKPRKGVTMEDVPHSKFLLSSLNKSNVKPRKGVEPYSTNDAPTSSSQKDETEAKNSVSASASSYHPVLMTTNHNSSEDLVSEDLLSALEKVFEDDTHATIIDSLTSSTISPSSTNISPTTVSEITPSASRSTFHSVSTSQYTTEPHVTLYSSYSNLGSSQTASSSRTPSIVTPFPLHPYSKPLNDFKVSKTVSQSTTYFLTLSNTHQPSTMTPLLANVSEKTNDKLVVELNNSYSDEESESDRKYKSSIHLVLSLVFGLLVLFAVLGVVAKRVYDGWLRRDYYRMNYLIDGIYNGVD